MATIPNGNYGVTVINSDGSLNSSLSGLLAVTGPSNASFMGTDVSSGFNSTSGSIGWSFTPQGGAVITFSNGTYDAGPPATVTGGAVAEAGTSDMTWEVPTLPLGHFAVIVAPDVHGVSGSLDLTTNPSTYKGQPISGLNVTSGQIGWAVTLPPSGPGSQLYTFSAGVYTDVDVVGQRAINNGKVHFDQVTGVDETYTADASTNMDEDTSYKRTSA